MSDNERVEAIRKQNIVPHCMVVVSSAIPGCFCYRPKGHSGAHSEPVQAEDSFIANADIDFLLDSLTRARQEAFEEAIAVVGEIKATYLKPENRSNRVIGYAAAASVIKGQLEAARDNKAAVLAETGDTK